MSGLRPPDDLSPFTRELLDLGRSESAASEIHAHATQAALRALGTAEVAAGGAASSLASGAVIKLAATVGVVVLGVGFWRFADSAHHVDAASRSQVAQSSGAATAGAASSAASAQASAASVAPAAADSVMRTNPEHLARTVAQAASGARSTDELSQEIAILDRARALLAAGDAKGAVRAVEAQRMRVLVPEALALKVEALVANGEGTRASKLATKFLEGYPASPLARHVAELRASVKPSSSRAKDEEHLP